LTNEFKDFISDKNISTNLDLGRIVSLVKERASFTNELWDQSSVFFEAPQYFDEKDSTKAFKAGTPRLLQNVIDILEVLEDYQTDTISEKMKDWIKSENIGFGEVMMPLRLALVGEMKGPEVFDIISVLGKEESISRIKKAIGSIA